MSRIISVLLIAIVSITNAYAESVIPEGFTGHVTSSGTIETGDAVMVEITQDVKLKVKSTRATSQAVFFEFTGGEGGSLLSFMPTGQSSGTKTLDSEETVTFATTLAVSVEAIDGNGMAEISGSRTFEAEGGSQILRLYGRLPVESITPGDSVPFSRILDARLTYLNLLASGSTAITADDFPSEQRLAPLYDETGAAGADETAGQPAVEGEVLPVLPGADAGQPNMIDEPVSRSEYTLSDEKKKQLFIQYVNEFMRLIFM